MIMLMKEDGPLRSPFLFLFMTEALNELQSLTSSMNGNATIVIENGYASRYLIACEALSTTKERYAFAGGRESIARAASLRDRSAPDTAALV